jgi:peptidylprolyl isomerase/peptidyl-prolyl cis-trans isomerase B (cyclophilin B)
MISSIAKRWGWLAGAFLLALTACSPKPKGWDAPPPMTIETDRIYIATLETEKGEIVIQLFAEQAPMTVNNFVFLAREGFYDGTTFHRVIEGFMAQGGDPTGTGSGGPGYTFADEIDPALRFDQPGLLAMANSGPNTNGSQFFITFGPAPHLNGRHTIFGKVVEGMQVALSLTPRDPADNPDFEGDTLMRVVIEEVEKSLLPTPTPTLQAIIPQMEEGRPLAFLPIEDRQDLYSGMPEMILQEGLEYRARVVTTQGEFLIALEPESAPQHVNNFVVLAQLGYYDGFPINLVDPQGVVITGSPGGYVESDIGYTLPDEVGLSNVRGAVGFWFRLDLFAPSGSEIYILTRDQTDLDSLYTVFGYVVEGMDVVDSLTTRDFIQTIVIETP